MSGVGEGRVQSRQRTGEIAVFICDDRKTVAGVALQIAVGVDEQFIDLGLQALDDPLNERATPKRKRKGRLISWFNVWRACSAGNPPNLASPFRRFASEIFQ